MTSKRRMRRIRGKMRATTVAESIRRGLLQAIDLAGAKCGPESLAVLDHLISPDSGRRSFATLQLSEKQAEAIKNAKMDLRHGHLDALLEDDFGRRLLKQKGTIPLDVDLEI
jgi:hypothetical protein